MVVGHPPPGICCVVSDSVGNQVYLVSSPFVVEPYDNIESLERIKAAVAQFLQSPGSRVSAKASIRFI